MWTNTRYGVGWDIAPPPEAEAETAADSGPNQDPGEDVELPEIIAYEGELTQDVFDELWEIAIRWEVGENRIIVPHARDRIVAFGMPVLPFVVNEMEDDYSLAVRAFNYIYPKLMELDREVVLAAIREASASDVYTQRNCVLRVVGDLKLIELEDVVTGYFDDPQLRRRAIGVIGKIGSHAADEQLLRMLNDAIGDEGGVDEKELQAAIISAANLELKCSLPLFLLLEHEIVSVRECVAGQLVVKWDTYRNDMEMWLGFNCGIASGFGPSGSGGRAVNISDTGLRALLAVLRRLDDVPREYTVYSVSLLADNPDWGLRADAISLLRHWDSLPLKGELRRQLNDVMHGVKTSMRDETHPYVLHVWNETK